MARGVIRWHECIESGADLIRKLPLARIAPSVPMLLDSIHREKVEGFVLELPDPIASADPALAYARATVSARRDPVRAMEWLLRAHALTDARSPLLAARIARDLGALYLTRGEPAAARAVYDWTNGLLGRHADRSADLHALAGLSADHAGDAARARLMNERSIATSACALTPETRVVALTNLAVASTHRDPRTSIALCSHALAIAAADRLHQSIEAPIRNALGYAFIPVRDLVGARKQLSCAAELARRHEHIRVALFARFNLSIVAELEGDLTGAAEALISLRGDALRHGQHDLVQWASIRSAWLVQRTAGDTVSDVLRDAALERITPPQQRAAATLLAIAGTAATLRHGDLADLASEALANDDRVEALALQLQVAAREHAAGRERAARRWVREAERVALSSGLCVGTNWWGPDLIDVAMAHGHQGFAASLHRPAAATTHRRIRIATNGDLEVDGQLALALWREGRTGSRVLRRFFEALVRTYPDAVSRDALCDLLWPESDGDRAVHDLYAATDDLRKALRTVPGVRLVTDMGFYRLDIASWVAIASRESRDPAA